MGASVGILISFRETRVRWALEVLDYVKHTEQQLLSQERV